MTKIDIFSGFLGAGKTTLIKKLIKEAYAGEKLVLIENEFGEIGIDGGFLRDAGIQITEMNSGCICCSLVGDFGRALTEVLERFHPDRILIEPSGVGKLSDVIRAVQGIHASGAELNGFTTVVDANKCKMYRKNFGEFFCDQIENASSVILSHTDNMSEEKLAACVALVRELNPDATLITTPWSQLSGAQILAAMEKKNTLQAELARLAAQAEEDDDDDDDCCHHDHHHHDHDDHDEDDDHDHDHCCHHDHDDDDDDHDHEEHEHHHHHHDGECSCGHHHHHHDADEVFSSFGRETARKYTHEEIENALRAFTEDTRYGMILRAKGIVPAVDGTWIHFDYVPGEPDVRTGSADVTGRLCVIGSQLDEGAIAALFGLE